MALPRSEIDESGQVLIPLPVRQELGLEPTDQVEFEVENGRAVLRPVRASIFDFFMSIPALDPPISDDDMEEAFEQGVADEVVAEMAREKPAGR
jgi:AbrB family looped-hinge helix DNA binding protein